MKKKVLYWYSSIHTGGRPHTHTHTHSERKIERVMENVVDCTVCKAHGFSFRSQLKIFGHDECVRSRARYFSPILTHSYQIFITEMKEDALNRTLYRCVNECFGFLFHHYHHHHHLLLLLLFVSLSNLPSFCHTFCRIHICWFVCLFVANK